MPWRQENNDRIKLVADKNEYKVGDTAEILVPSPYQGKVKALLTIERGQVLDHQVIELTGNSEVLKLPITDQYVPERVRVRDDDEGHGRDEPGAFVQGRAGAAEGLGGRDAAAGDPDPRALGAATLDGRGVGHRGRV